MADQTPLIAGLAGGLGVGLVLIVLLGICVYYQHKKMKKTKDTEYIVKPDNANSVTAAPKQIPHEMPAQQNAAVDLNPETGQPLPMVFEASTQGVAFAPQQPTSIVSPVFLQPSLAFNSNAGASNPFMNKLYPQPDGVPYGNDALLPEMGPMPSRFRRVGFHKSTSWLGPQQQFQQLQLQQQQQQQQQHQQHFNAYHDYNPMNRQPVVEEDIERINVLPLGSNERFAFSDGEEIERKKKKRRTKEVEFVVREDTSKYKNRRSKHHSSSDSSSDSSSESDSSGSDSDSSTESVSKLRVIQPGKDSFYLVEDGKNKKKKKHKKHKRIIAMIPQAPAPAPQPAPVQPPPPPPPPPQPNPQPMIFVLPGACQQQQVEQPRVSEYEVRPVSVPAPTIPHGSAFWSADGQVSKKPAFFKAGGGTGNAEYETQERSAQIGDDNVDYGPRRMNVQIGVSSGYSGGGCTSCEAGGTSYGGGGYQMSAGNGGGYGRTGMGYGSSQSGAVQQTSGTSQDGYEEAGYSMNF